MEIGSGNGHWETVEVRVERDEVCLKALINMVRSVSCLLDWAHMRWAATAFQVATPRTKQCWVFHSAPALAMFVKVTASWLSGRIRTKQEAF